MLLVTSLSRYTKFWRASIQYSVIALAGIALILSAASTQTLANSPSLIAFSPPSSEDYKAAFEHADILVQNCDAGDVAACRLAFDAIDTPMERLQEYLGRNRITDKGYRLPPLDAEQKAFFARYQKMMVQIGVAGCIRDHGYSCYRIGFANLHGLEGERVGNLENLKKPLEKSCKLGSPDGCAALAGTLWLSSDTEKLKRARDLSSKACAEKSANGCAIYGYLLKNGKGGPQDYALAAGFLRFGCHGGHSRACRDIAEQYEKGLGVPQNSNKAESYYSRMCPLPFGQAGCRKADEMQREREEDA